MSGSFMRPALSGLAVILLFTLGRSALAGIRPSFNLDYSSWQATDVVVVATASEGGVFQVTEVWKGNLLVGDWVDVPELRPVADAAPISSYPAEPVFPISNAYNIHLPKQAPGSRMVLFLKRGTNSGKSSDSPAHYGSWESADLMADMKASAVWIEGERLYCFLQVINPGPSILTRCPIQRDSSAGLMSESTLQQRVIEVSQIHSQFESATEVLDSGARATRLRPFVQSDVFSARLAALDALGKCGVSGMPILEEMLDDPAFADQRAQLIEVLAQAGGKAAGPELAALLQRDLAFWQAVGPSLHEGWWNQDPTPHFPLRQRYSETYQTILALEQVRYGAALGPALRLQDFWRSLPQLNDKSGLNEMASECGKLIGLLQTH